jgi:carboxyl-terminal processing protease
VSKKQLAELVKTAQFEGYYDEAREAFDALEAKLTHDVGRDLDEHETVLRQMLEQDIVAAYYYQSGVLEAGLRHDRQLEAAVGVLTEKIAEKR